MLRDRELTNLRLVLAAAARQGMVKRGRLLEHLSDEQCAEWIVGGEGWRTFLREVSEGDILT
jgi:hypothetical protein